MAKKAPKPKGRKAPSARPLSRWQLIENVVAACERIKNKLPGVVVTQKALLPVRSDPTDRREIDVLVELPAAERHLLIGIEVKERGTRKLHTAELGALIDLKNEIGLHYLCVVCTRGFTEGAQRKAERNGIQLAVPEQITDTGFFPPSNQPLVFAKGVTIEAADFTPHPRFSPAEHLELKTATSSSIADDYVVVDLAGNEVPLWHVLQTDCNRAAELYDPSPKHGELLSITLNGFSQSFRAIKCKGREIPLVDEMQVLARYVHRQIPHESFRILGLEVATFVREVSGSTHQVTMAAIPAEGKPGLFRIAFTQGPTHPTKAKK